MGPIEPVALTAATLLATKALEALGGKTGEATWAGLSRLMALVRGTVSGHRQAEATLTELENHPDDQGRIRRLAEVLVAFGAQDAKFHRELVALVGEARRDPIVGSLATQVYGQAQVDQLVNVGQARDIYIQPPSSPATDMGLPAEPGPVRWPTSGRTVSNLPPRNLIFTGRDEQLTVLQQRLSAASTAAIVQPLALHGLGGVGKTQLALEFAYRQAREYDVIWWVAAEQAAAIPGQLVALARRLGISEQAEQAETVAMLFDELRHRNRWLLVFDNAEQPHDLRPYWPSGRGHMLVTSRNPSWQPLAATTCIDVLPHAEAIAFLQHRVGIDKPNADRLSEALGDLPLALEQAAAYLEQTHTPPNQYVELLTSRAHELFALGRPVTSEQTIATIWDISLQRLRTEGAAAEDLLHLCAFMAPDHIPRWLIEDHPDVLPPSLAGVVRDRLAYHQALGTLSRYSLATATDEAISVHRLVQAVVRHQLQPDQRRQWGTTAKELIAVGFPKVPEEVGAWPTAALLLPHALAVADHASLYPETAETTAALLIQAARYLRGRVELDQARLVLERALMMCEAHLGQAHATTALNLVSLASVLYDQGDLDGARILDERGLAIREALLGPDHPDTALSLDNLAIDRRAQGDLDAARTFHERALSIREARLGPDHPDTAASLHNLATVLYQQGDMSSARPLLERALAIREHQLGAAHPATGWNLASLALVLEAQGDLAGARSLHERAVAIRTDSLGADHPDTAWSLNGLAAVLHAQGNLEAARTLHERALAIRQLRLGSEHPATARSLNYVAEVLADQGDLDRARSFHERALTIYEARLGPDHPDTARTREMLGAVVTQLNEA